MRSFDYFNNTSRSRHEEGRDETSQDQYHGYSSTYAITIDAPAYAVWRLFKQIGAEKSGSFSSEFLERTFARLPFFNSYEIQEEFQQPDSMMSRLRLHFAAG